jgi:hypothetical protein
MGMSPPARVLVGAGVLALLLDIVNQAGATRLDPALERASVLAGALAVVLMLVGLLWTRIEPTPPERADLQGEEGFERIPELPESLDRELGWGSLMLLSATPAAVVLLHWDGRTVLRRGLLQHGAGPFRPRGIPRPPAGSALGAGAAGRRAGAAAAGGMVAPLLLQQRSALGGGMGPPPHSRMGSGAGRRGGGDDGRLCFGTRKRLNTLPPGEVTSTQPSSLRRPCMRSPRVI